MNYLINDQGQEVIAIGAPNSDARILTKYPKLFKALSEIPEKYYYVNDLVKTINKHGVKDTSEQLLIVQVFLNYKFGRD